MARPYSMDLRERAVAAVEGGMSRNAAARQFRVAIKHGHQVDGAVSGDRQRGARPDGRLQAAVDPGRARSLAVGADQARRLHVARAGGRARRARSQGGLSIGVDLCPRTGPELQKKPRWPANRIVRTSREGARSGIGIRTGSMPALWCFSTRPGPRPTWRRSGAGHQQARGSKPRFRTAAGRP